MRIIPSIASARMLNIEDSLRRLSGCSSLHLDIEDGNFIPNITFGIKTIREISRASDIPLNAHLMVTNPEKYITPLGECGVKEIAFHLESSPYPLEIIHKIKRMGMKAGLAYNFATAIENGEAFFDDIDFLLVMTSEADGEDQRFRQSSLKRIRCARKLLGSKKPLWVDGGVGEKELPLVYGAGADTAVMGRAVVSDSNPVEKMKHLESLILERGHME